MIKEPKPQGYYTDKVFTPAEMDKAIAKEREQLILFLRNLADDHTPTDCADMICALQSLGAIRARGENK